MRQCSTCGHRDIGTYCSKCGEPIKPAEKQHFQETVRELFSLNVIRTWFLLLIRPTRFFDEFLDGNYHHKVRPVTFFLATYAAYLSLGQLCSSPTDAIIYYDVLATLDEKDQIEFGELMFPERFVQLSIDSARFSAALDTTLPLGDRITALIVASAQLEAEQQQAMMTPDPYAGSGYWELRYPGSSEMSAKVMREVGSILAQDVADYLAAHQHTGLAYRFTSGIRDLESESRWLDILVSIILPLMFFLQVGFMHRALKGNRTRSETTSILMYLSGYVLLIYGVMEVVVWNAFQDARAVTIAGGILALPLLAQFDLTLWHTHGASFWRQLYAFGVPAVVSSMIAIVLTLFILFL